MSEETNAAVEPPPAEGPPEGGPTPEQVAEFKRQVQAIYEQAQKAVALLEVELPIDPDHPMWGVYLGLDPNEAVRQSYASHVVEPALDVAMRVNIARQVDEDPHLAEASALLDGYPLAEAVLGSSRDIPARMFTMALVERELALATQAYEAYWFETPPVPALLERLERWLADSRADDPAALATIGRPMVRAAGDVLERRYNPIADDYDALEAAGIEPLVRLFKLLARIGGNAAAFLLADYLMAVNHPKVERAAREALATMPGPATAAVSAFLEGEDLEEAQAYVLLELLCQLGSDDGPRRVAREILFDASKERRAAMDPDDFEDLVDLFLANQGPLDPDNPRPRWTRPLPIVGALLALKDPLPDATRAKLEAFAAAHPDQDEVREMRRRIEEDLPHIVPDLRAIEAWGEILAERWPGEDQRERIGRELVTTARFDLDGYTTADLSPPTGPKEAFLAKILVHEVKEQMAAIAPRLPPTIDQEEVVELQRQLGNQWWLVPRSETGWKAPIISVYEERRDQMVASTRLRRAALEPVYRGHLLSVVANTRHDDASPELMRTHLDVGERFLPAGDPLVAYAKDRLEAWETKHRKKSTALWTPDQGRSVGTIQRDAGKVGRNDPCPCGSGKKYKKCCM